VDEDSNQGGLSELIASLEKRFTSGSGTTYEGSHNDYLANHPAIAASIHSITCLPTKEDYPLWRVRCKVTPIFFNANSLIWTILQPGLEEEVVFFILQKASPWHEIRSAFAIASSVRGWVYLEATMNDNLRSLLRLTPGVLYNRCGLCSQRIPCGEGLELLKMHSLKPPPQLGKWAQVLKGTYKDDVGYVSSIAASEVHLLLIPRLAPMGQSHSKRNRTRTRRTILKLFNPETAKQDYAIEPHRVHENIYSLGNNRFEHGLIERPFRFDSVSTAVSTISLECFGLFRESGHPKLISSKSAFPRPLEWHFSEGDEVYIIDDEGTWPNYLYKSGHISTLRNESVEVETERGIVVASWMAICRVIRVSDFVEVMGGLHKGQRGWVDAVEINPDTQVASIIRLLDEEKFSDCLEVRPM
jgi:hypothetical protein